MKSIFYILVIALSCVLIGSCLHLYRVSRKNEKELAQYKTKKFPETINLGKVLVVYYSLSGNTKNIAEQIQQKTNADIFEIKTKEPFQQGIGKYMDVKKQLLLQKYPEIEPNLPNFSKYDIIFVGAPVWWYTMATPLYSFLQKADFRNKQVVPFSTQGSNVGSFFEDFEKNARRANLKQKASFNNIPPKYAELVKQKISAWLLELKSSN